MDRNTDSLDPQDDWHAPRIITRFRPKKWDIPWISVKTIQGFLTAAKVQYSCTRISSTEPNKIIVHY